MAPHDSARAIGSTNACLTRLRFRSGSRRMALTLVTSAMSLATAELPTDPDELRAFALACQSELKVAELSVQVKALEVEKLKFQLAKLRRMQFGRSSERSPSRSSNSNSGWRSWKPPRPRTSPQPKPPRLTRPSARKPNRSASRCRSICRGRTSPISRLAMVPAPAPIAGKVWRA